MKHITLLLLLALMAGCNGLMEDWQTIASGERDVTWQSLDGAAGTMNANPGLAAGSPRLLSADGKLFAAWVENGTMMVRLYSGDDSMPFWITLPSPPVGSLNLINLAWHNGQIHVIMVNTAPDPDILVVYRLSADMSNWEDLAGAAGISTGAASLTNPILVTFNGALYALWNEGTIIRMRRHQGGTTWSPFGPTGVEIDLTYGINDSAVSCNVPSVTVYNGFLVLGLKYSSRIGVKAFNGTSWSTWLTEIVRVTGDGGISASVHATNGRLYLALVEQYMNYNGLWAYDISNGQLTAIDIGAPAKTGLKYHNLINTNQTGTTFDPLLNSVNGRLYLMWRERENNGAVSPANLATVRCRLYSGDITAPAWMLIDGGGYFGIRNNDSYTIPGMDTTSHDSRIYVIFCQSNGTADQAHVTVGY